MPRKNNRRPQGDPTTFSTLLSALQDEWAVKTGRTTWQDLKQARKDARARSRYGEQTGSVGDPANRRYQEAAAKRAADRPVSLDDAREKLAAIFNARS